MDVNNPSHVAQRCTAHIKLEPVAAPACIMTQSLNSTVRTATLRWVNSVLFIWPNKKWQFGCIGKKRLTFDSLTALQQSGWSLSCVWFSSLSSDVEHPLDKCLLQTMFVKLQPASGTRLPAYNPLLPPPAISQVLLLANPQKVSLRSAADVSDQIQIIIMQNRPKGWIKISWDFSNRCIKWSRGKMKSSPKNKCLLSGVRASPQKQCCSIFLNK